MPLLEVQGIDVSYGEVQVLWDVSLSIGEGEIVSVVGGNGSGKSTILDTLSGLNSVRKGSIRLNGQEISQAPAYQRVGLGLVQIPEGRKIFPYMSVQANLVMGSFNPRARKRREASLARVYQLFPRLEERKKQLARTLSGGEQQMLAVARGLMAQPRVLMMDEPSLGLAPLLVKATFESIKTINQQGITVLLVEQNVKQSLALSQRGYVLENGRVVLEGPSQDLLHNEHLRTAYLGI